MALQPFAYRIRRFATAAVAIAFEGCLPHTAHPKVARNGRAACLPLEMA
jgi:hypothetical protein